MTTGMGKGGRSKRLRSPESDEVFSHAERAALRRVRDGLSFSSVPVALGWYFERRERHQAPQGLHPRGELAPDGQVVILDIEGGGGGDIAEVLTTISTIGAALRALELAYPRAHELIVLSERDGVSARKLGERCGLSHATISVELGRAEAYLRGRLGEAGVIR